MGLCSKDDILIAYSVAKAVTSLAAGLRVDSPHSSAPVRNYRAWRLALWNDREDESETHGS